MLLIVLELLTAEEKKKYGVTFESLTGCEERHIKESYRQGRNKIKKLEKSRDDAGSDRVAEINQNTEKEQTIDDETEIQTEEIAEENENKLDQTGNSENEDNMDDIDIDTNNRTGNESEGGEETDETSNRSPANVLNT